MDGGLTDSIRMAVQWLFVPLLAFAVFAWLCLKIEALGVFETIRSAVRRMSAFQRFAPAKSRRFCHMDILRTSGGQAFALVSVLAYCMCWGEGCCEKREKWSDDSTYVMSMVTNWLQVAADCIGKPLCQDENWRQASQQCEKLDAWILAITDMRERLRLAAWIERTVYKVMESQTNNAATLEFCFTARRTIDSVVNVLWASTGDTNLVLGVWERLHRKVVSWHPAVMKNSRSWSRNTSGSKEIPDISHSE